MATYLQGVTDYIPDYQPFQPDLNFYGSAMQTKQTQYDSNWKSLNNLYADLHNADLTHDLNIKKKDDVLKQIDFNLKRVTGLDLSLQQNVDQATQVFRPFYEDKYLMKDMAWTKNYTTKLSHALNLKNSQDEKMRGQYWDTGIKDMQYRREEFKNATLEETLNMGNASYTPYVNAMEKYLKLAKETGLSVDIKDVDASGMYFVREKNGQALMSPLQNLFMSAYANDPALQAVYATQSYVKRKDYAEQYATKFNGNKDEAEKEYLRDQYKFLQNYTASKKIESKEAVDVNKNKAKAAEQAQASNESSPFTESYFESLNKALAIDETVADHAEKLDKDINGGKNNTIATSGVTGDPNVLDFSNMELARLKVDAGTASILAEQDIIGAADIYAYKDYVLEKSANPVGLENMRHQNALARIDHTHKLKKDEMKLKAAYDIENNRIKQGLADGTIWYDKNGQMQENDGAPHTITLGSTSGQFGDEINKMAHNANTYNETVSNLTGTYIGNNLLRLKQLADNNAISNKDAWEALSWLDPNSKEAKTKYGTKDGKKLIYKLWNEYQNNNDKFVLNFTKTNQVIKLKKFMDGWASKNTGDGIADAYHDDKSGMQIQKYVIYRDQANIINKENQTKINKQLVKTLTANESFAWLKPETKAKIADAYNKYNKTHAKFNYDEFAVLIDKELGYKTQYKRWSASGTSTVGTYVGAGSGTSPVSSFSKRSGIDLENLYQTLSGGYLKAVNQTGPEGIKSFAGIVRTKDGRYALGTNDVTAQDVILSKPGWGGFTAFQQGMADINRIRFTQNPEKYAVTYGGLTKYAANEKTLDAAEMKAMLREMQMSSGKNKTAPFKIARSSVALEDPNLRALIIVPPQDVLKKYIKDDAGAVDWAKIKEIRKNGISFIAPKSAWTNDFINENELTPTEQILNASGQMQYQHGGGAGKYTIAKVKNVPGVDYAISFSGNWINDDGTVTIKKDYMPFQKSGNMIDASQDEIFNTIQTINEHNMQQFRKFQSTGNQKALANVKTYYKKPEWSGFKY
jgi:hypothetical protein